MEIEAVMEGTPLVIEAFVYDKRNRVTKCVICGKRVEYKDPVIRVSIDGSTARQFFMHGAGCAMAALFTLMKKWNELNTNHVICEVQNEDSRD